MPPALRPQAQQGAETRTEASEIDAPPYYADGHAHRVLVGHRGTKEAAAGAPNESPKPEAECPFEPATRGIRGGSFAGLLIQTLDRDG